MSDLKDHKWLDPECGVNGCQSLVWKQRLERTEELADKYKWQVRDTCTRAEAAEQECDGARTERDWWQRRAERAENAIGGDAERKAEKNYRDGLERERKRLRGTLEYILEQAKAGYPTVLSVIKANASAALDDEWQKTYAAARAALEAKT